MALNEVYAEGFSLNYSVDPAVESGDFVVLDGIRGVAEIDAKVGADGDSYATLRHIGVFTGTSAEAFTVGQEVYLASGTFGTELATSGSELVGYAVKAKDAVAGDVHVRINN
jgi:predicted RecA/RadA family phage recombinase